MDGLSENGRETGCVHIVRKYFRLIECGVGSDIIYLNALGSHLLVINSFDAARDLLEKKSSLYSSRPRLVLINEL